MFDDRPLLTAEQVIECMIDIMSVLESSGVARLSLVLGAPNMKWCDKAIQYAAAEVHRESAIEMLMAQAGIGGGDGLTAE